MAKKDSKDETPIEFYIPGPGGRGSRVPVPINQPNWIYKTFSSNSKPHFSEWLVIGIMLVGVVAFAALLIIDSRYKSPLWLVVISFGILIFFSTRSAIIRTLSHKQKDEKDEDIKTQNKREKKRNKHRKDYK